MLAWVSYTYIIDTEIFQKSDLLIHKKLFIIEKLQIKCELCLLYLVSDFLFPFFLHFILLSMMLLMNSEYYIIIYVTIWYHFHTLLQQILLLPNYYIQLVCDDTLH